MAIDCADVHVTAGGQLAIGRPSAALSVDPTSFWFVSYNFGAGDLSATTSLATGSSTATVAGVMFGIDRVDPVPVGLLPAISDNRRGQLVATTSVRLLLGCRSAFSLAGIYLTAVAVVIDDWKTLTSTDNLDVAPAGWASAIARSGHCIADARPLRYPVNGLLSVDRVDRLHVQRYV